MNIQQLAYVGSVIETEVRSPVNGKIQLRLDTPQACAFANKLLMDKNSGWRIIQQAKVS